MPIGQLAHTFTLLQETDGLSMAQLAQLQESHRAMCYHLDQVTISLARKQEREAVEARIGLELEKHAGKLAERGSTSADTSDVCISEVGALRPKG